MFSYGIFTTTCGGPGICRTHPRSGVVDAEAGFAERIIGRGHLLSLLVELALSGRARIIAAPGKKQPQQYAQGATTSEAEEEGNGHRGVLRLAACEVGAIVSTAFCWIAGRVVPRYVRVATSHAIISVP
jgi:hypothetical protein